MCYKTNLGMKIDESIATERENRDGSTVNVNIERQRGGADRSRLSN